MPPPDATPTSHQARARRRAQLARSLRQAGGGIALLMNALPSRRNGDSDHPFRSSSAFLYLCGLDEPGAALLIDARGHSTVFCQPKDAVREQWDGARLGPDAAPAALGVDAACALDQLHSHVVQALAGQGTLWTVFDPMDTQPVPVDAWFAGAQTTAPAHRDLGPVLAEMRLRKDALELSHLRRAAHISAGAHVRAMRHARPGQHEYELEAELLHEFRRHGATGPAYPSIVAAGANACVLHHPAGPGELRAGELCLIDAGCEVEGYASDITRCFPVSGRFSPAQRALYDLVLAAQHAAVAQIRPGARKQDAHWAAVRVLAQGLLDLKLLRADEHGLLDDIIANAAYRRYFMHGTGHWLGLDVHDAGEYLALDEAPVDQPDGSGGRVTRPPSRPLEAGMVVTVEPGLYVRPADDIPEAFWNLGIRIEDDAVVTDQGCELISREVPVAASEIEALMRS